MVFGQYYYSYKKFISTCQSTATGNNNNDNDDDGDDDTNNKDKLFYIYTLIHRYSQTKT